MIHCKGDRDRRNEPEKEIYDSTPKRESKRDSLIRNPLSSVRSRSRLSEICLVIKVNR